MKIKFLFILVLSCSFLQAKEGINAEKGNKQKTEYGYSWEVNDSLDSPESAYFDPVSNHIYISNVIGGGNKKDGEGTIQKLHWSGKILDVNWVTGLNAPKGMRAHKGVLWVSDIDEVVSINIKTGKILNKIKIKGAKFLNDIAITKAGIVFVSDTLNSSIYQIENNKWKLFLSGKDLESPNGLLIRGKKLIVAAWGFTQDWSTKTLGRVYAIDLKTKVKTVITKKPLGNLDGLEIDYNGDYLVSDWVAGKVFKVTSGGKIKTLFSGFKGSADIGFLGSKKMLVVPRMAENIVTAYDLSKYPGYN